MDVVGTSHILGGGPMNSKLSAYGIHGLPNPVTRSIRSFSVTANLGCCGCPEAYGMPLFQEIASLKAAIRAGRVGFSAIGKTPFVC
jgi:hypothetical protein